MEVGTSEAEPIWTEFLRKLTRRGLRGVKLVVSDAHEGLKAAVTKVLSATGSAAGSTSCATFSPAPARAAAVSSPPSSPPPSPRRHRKPQAPNGAPSPTRSGRRKLAVIMDDAEEDVLAYMTFPKEHRAKLHSTNPIERLNGEIKRRTEVVGIFPNDDVIVRLVGAILLEQNDEWAVQRARYMTLETISQMSDDPLISLPAVAR